MKNWIRTELDVWINLDFVQQMYVDEENNIIAKFDCNSFKVINICKTREEAQESLDSLMFNL